MKISRRTLFQRTSIGVAAAGALIAAPRILGSQAAPALGAAHATGKASSANTAAAAPAVSSEPVMAYIRDSAKGEIALYMGTREIIRHDPDLVSRLLQAGA
jgi:hypothetical protein